MNKLKTYLPILTLVVGLMGLFFFPRMVLFDGGLFSDMQFPGSEYKNAAGDELYTFNQLFKYTERAIRARATIWALDVLSVYMVIHGILGCAINGKNLVITLKEKRKPLILLLILSIPAGIAFWILLWKIIWKLGIPTH